MQVILNFYFKLVVFLIKNLYICIVFIKNVNMILHLLFLLGLASLSIEAADSTLSTTIKRWLYIDRERSWVRALSQFNFYKRALPSWLLAVLGIPIFVIIIITNILRLFIGLIACPYCISAWAGFLFSFLIQNYDPITSIIFGGITIILTRIIDRFLCL